MKRKEYLKVVLILPGNVLINIPLEKEIGSLNVSVATGIFLHEVKGKDFG